MTENQIRIVNVDYIVYIVAVAVFVKMVMALMVIISLVQKVLRLFGIDIQPYILMSLLFLFMVFQGLKFRKLNDPSFFDSHVVGNMSCY